LNAQVRALVDEATQHRIQRDELNAQVKTAKEERDRYNRRVNELQDQLTELKRRKLPRGTVPLGKLQQEPQRLEFPHMTSEPTGHKRNSTRPRCSRKRSTESTSSTSARSTTTTRSSTASG